MANDFLSVDKIRDATVAKIAMQCSEYYAEALRLLQLYSVSQIWPKVSSHCHIDI